MTNLRKIFVLTITITALTAFTGCGGGQGSYGKFNAEEMELIRYPTKSALPAPTGGFTMNVGDQSLSASQVIAIGSEQFITAARGSSEYSQFQATAKPAMQAIITRRIADMLLYQEAQKSMPENIDEDIIEKAVEDEVRKFIASHNGNYSSAQKAIQQMGLNWDTFRDYQKRMMITQFYIVKETSKQQPISHQDIVNYYNAIKEGRFVSKPSFQFRLIDIDFDEVEVIEPNDPNQPKATKKQVAMEIADEVFAKAKAGEDFAELAKQYSHGFAADDGGLWEPATYGGLAEPYNIIEGFVEKMEKGDITGPIEVPGHAFVVRLEYKVAGGQVPLAKVQDRLEKELNFMRKRQKMDELMLKFINKVDARNIDEFVETCLKETYYRYRM